MMKLVSILSFMLISLPVIAANWTVEEHQLGNHHPVVETSREAEGVLIRDNIEVKAKLVIGCMGIEEEEATYALVRFSEPFFIRFGAAAVDLTVDNNPIPRSFWRVSEDRRELVFTGPMQRLMGFLLTSKKVMLRIILPVEAQQETEFNLDGLGSSLDEMMALCKANQGIGI